MYLKGNKDKGRKKKSLLLMSLGSVESMKPAGSFGPERAGFEQLKKLLAASGPCQAELTKKPGCCGGVSASWEQHGSRTGMVQKKKK